jgi:hypothetical protein
MALDPGITDCGSLLRSLSAREGTRRTPLRQSA